MQDALERGFATLMSLESGLQRVRTGSDDAVAEELAAEIEALRGELGELRARTPSASPLASGFVLPR